MAMPGSSLPAAISRIAPIYWRMKGARFVHFFFVQPFDNGPVTHPKTQNQPAV